jgi:Flp pilus assembly protein TadG
MKLKQIHDDTRGNALVEFTVTVPFFLLLMFGLVQAGLLLHTQNGLQHGVEVAARCASVNYSAYQLGLSQSCFGAAVAPSAVTATTIQQYAAQNSWGLVPSSSTFTVDCPNSVTTGCATSNYTCGTNPGYRVTVNYSYNLINYIFNPISLTAKSCFPINVTS